MERIGHGAFATVYRHRGFALKRIDLFKTKRTYLEQEIALHQSLDHPFIVALIEVKWLPDYCDIYLELCDSDLQKQLSKKLGRDLIKRWFGELCSALEYLHEQNIIHRDLKPANVLIKSGHVRLSDFGFSKRVHNMAETICGSPLYMAPEILKHNQYNNKSDLWSLGCILYEMLNNKLYYTGSTIVNLIADIDAKSFSSDDPDYAQLLEGLIQRDPAQRWDWPTIKSKISLASSLQFSLEMNLTDSLIENYDPPAASPPPLRRSQPASTWKSLAKSFQDCVDLLYDAKSV